MHSEPVAHTGTHDHAMVQILLVSEHLILREGLRKLLETEPGFTVVAGASGPDDAWRAIERHQPDIMIAGLSARAQVRLMQTLQDGASQNHRVRSIVLTTTIERMQTIQALRLGVSGMLLEDTSAQMMFDCVRSVASGHTWIGREQLSDMAEALLRPTPDRTRSRLTSRELQIVDAVRRGDTNKTIARQLSIAETTVKHHLHNIYTKVGVFSRVQLAIFAINHKLAANCDGIVEDAGVMAPAL